MSGDRLLLLTPLRQALERIERKAQPFLADPTLLDREDGQDLLDVICMQFFAAGDALERLCSLVHQEMETGQAQREPASARDDRLAVTEAVEIRLPGKVIERLPCQRHLCHPIAAELTRVLTQLLQSGVAGHPACGGRQWPFVL